MKAKLLTLLLFITIVATNVKAATFSESISTRAAGDLGMVFWLPVSLGVIAALIIAFTTTGSYKNEVKHHS